MTLPLHLEQIHIREVENKQVKMVTYPLKPSIFSSETRAGLVDIRVVSQDPRQQSTIFQKEHENICSAKKI